MKKALLSIALASSLFAMSEYEKWLQQEQNSYQDYKKSMDEEFSDMLKKDWEMFNGMYTPTPYKKPKPKKLPTVKEETTPPKESIKKSKKIEIKKLEIPKTIKKEIPKIVKEEKPKKEIEKVISEIPKTPIDVEKIIEEPKEEIKKVVKEDIKKEDFEDIIPTTPITKPIVKKEEIKQKQYPSIKIDFFATNLEIPYKKSLEVPISSLSKESIGEFWKSVSKVDSKITLDEIKKLKKSMNLNDWAIYQLCYKFSLNLYENRIKANFLTWYLLTKLGYDVKIGYNKNDLYLLSTIKHKLYQVAYFNLDNKRYYVLTPNGRIGKVSNMFTYKGSYPKASKVMSFDIEKPIALNENVDKKELKFNYQGKNYTLDANYDRSVIDFYNTFPQSDYKIYFDAKTSNYITYSLLNNLREIIKDKTEVEAVNMLLRFTQKAFEYKTDENQFNYEKVMLPEETIFYPYSDCEDRAIMFRFLVENLTNLEVVGLKYSGHMATAVVFNSEVKGDKFKYNNKTYVIADPTYINANIGKSMPKYKNERFSIIK